MSARIRWFLLTGCALCASLEAPRAGAMLGEDLARLRAVGAGSLLRAAMLEAGLGRARDAQGEELASRGSSTHEHAPRVHERTDE